LKVNAHCEPRQRYIASTQPAFGRFQKFLGLFLRGLTASKIWLISGYDFVDKRKMRWRKIMKRSATVAHNPFWVVPLAVMLALFFGCAGGYGRLEKGPEVTAAFVEHRLPSDYRFYYTGRDNMPYAIVGIRDGYRFQSKFWKPIDPDSDAFKKMVRSPYGYQQSQVRGAFLIGPDGERVGMWYSAYDFASFRVTADRAVYVHSPYNPTDFGLEKIR
jgi:hypothetical protein